MNPMIDFKTIDKVSLADQLRAHILKKYEVEMCYIKEDYAPDELEAAAEYIHAEYLSLIEKCELVDNVVTTMYATIQARYLSVINNINELDNSKTFKIKTMLSYTNMVSSYANAIVLDNATSILLAASVKDYEFDEANFYLPVLSDEKVLNSIYQKGPTLDEQIQVAESVMEYMDDIPRETIVYNDAVLGSLNVIDQYEPTIQK